MNSKYLFLKLGTHKCTKLGGVQISTASVTKAVISSSLPPSNVALYVFLYFF